VGNSLYAPDAAGCLVYRYLLENEIPAGIDLVPGGLGGLDLLPFFENCRGVILVDRVVGFSPQNDVVLLDRKDILQAPETGYDHCGGLLYLLRSLPALGIEPELKIVGIETDGNDTAIRKAAELALEIACDL
jgi:hydrogenase maturation protease